MDLPDPEQVLADPASFRLPDRGDRAYAALAAVAAAVAANPTPERWTAGWQVLGLAADGAPDVAAVAARVLARCRPAGLKDMPPEIHLFIPVLKDAGLLPEVMPGPGASRGLGGGAAVGRQPVPVPGHRAVRRPGERRSRQRHGVGGRGLADARRPGADRGLVRGAAGQRPGPPRLPPAAGPRRAGPGRRASGRTRRGDWIRAADAEINDDLIPAGLDLPGQPVLPRDLGADDGLLAEQYFAGIRRPTTAGGEGGAGTKARSVAKGSGETAGTWLDCGSGADGMPRPGQGQDGRDEGGLPRWRAELLRRQVAQDVIAHGQQPGSVPAGLLRWAQEVVSPKVDWRAVLAAELRRAVAEVSGAVDYSYRRPSRRASVDRPGRAAGAAAAGARGGRGLRHLGQHDGGPAGHGAGRGGGAAAGARPGPAGPRAGLRHRGRGGPAGQLRPPGAADRRRRDRHGRGHRRGGRAAAAARGHGRAHRRVHAVAVLFRPRACGSWSGCSARGRRRRRRGLGRSG